MNNTTLVIVIALGLGGMYLLLHHKGAMNQQQLMYAPQATPGGSTAEGTGALIYDLTAGISNLINAGTNIAATVQRN